MLLWITSPGETKYCYFTVTRSCLYTKTTSDTVQAVVSIQYGFMLLYYLKQKATSWLRVKVLNV